MLGIDFDFPRYVAHRKGQVEQRARDGAAYSFSGERKLRRALTSTRPVSLAIEATTRLWKSKARRDLLATAEKASDRTHPRVFHAARAAGAALGLPPPPVVVPQGEFPVPSATLGTEEEPVVVIARPVIERLTDRELVALVGHELGHVQNNHVVYATALFYLRHEAFVFVRWIVQPAIMALSSWSRRAEVTCDRAALIAARDLEVTLSQMVKVTVNAAGTAAAGEPAPAEVSGDVRAQLAAMAEARGVVSGVTDLFRAHPHLVKRARALEVFAGSALYRKLSGDSTPGGKTAEEVDLEVHDIVKVFA